MWVGVAALAALYIPSTLPTPLYPLYRQQFGFSELVVTAIYASYVIGNLAALFVFGRLSDQIGRRPTSLAAGGLLVLSTLCFLAANSAGWLFAARILNGLAAGLGASALTAWIAELEPHHDRARAALVASSGNLAGLVIGAVIAGALGQWVAWPLRTSYGVFLLLLLIILLLLRAAPESVRQVAHSAEQVSLRPRLGVPREIRGAFLAPAAIAFAAFALGGFYAALTPGLLSQSLHISNRAVTGGVVAVFFGSGAVAAALIPHRSNRFSIVLATLASLLGLALLLIAEQLASLAILLAAAIASGAAIGIGYRSSLQIVNQIAPQARRAEVVSTFLLVCYTANALPVIGVGLLASAAGAFTAHLTFACLLAVLGISACVTGWKCLPRDAPG
ncbi:MAG: MFS transporter [Steroidobacteraceae bacterium]